MGIIGRKNGKYKDFWSNDTKKLDRVATTSNLRSIDMEKLHSSVIVSNLRYKKFHRKFHNKND